ncbi:MAG: hypothetical protein IPK63_18300 [Candidatus Competibacteraceae bacterium]|nr:hypothetical protein [Candidatus Competibacteraceae bacterium]
MNQFDVYKAKIESYMAATTAYAEAFRYKMLIDKAILDAEVKRLQEDAKRLQ